MDQLDGKVILVVEDEYFIAAELCRSLETAGVRVLGPAGRLGDALDLIAQSDHIDGALVDLSLHGVTAFPVADALAERCVPFLFVTGYDDAAIPERYRSVPHYQKPVALDFAREVLFG